MPTLAYDYLNASGRRLRTQNILTVVNSRVRLQINGMWVPKWGVMANVDLYYYPDFCGGTFKGTAQTNNGQADGIMYFRVP
jgi:hypothetical protein